MPTFFVIFMTETEENLVYLVEEAATPVLEEAGLELVEVQYRLEKTGWVLRIFIDRAFYPDRGDGSEQAPEALSGVTLDDCVEVSREIGRLLDVKDIIPTAYTLEVSSPGLDRPLTKPKDYFRFSGRLVKVKTVGPEGKRTIKGRLKGLSEDLIELVVEGREEKIPREQASRVQLVPELDWSR